MKTILCIVFIAICTGNVAGITRRYYIAAVERIWDYMPTRENILPSLQAAADQYTVQDTSFSNPRIGKEYLKAIYREFTDDTFLVEKQTPPWQGIIGPIIHAETGDIIEVHFKNNASKPYSIHPHGVKYQKRYEGALYADGTLIGSEDKADDAVPPGQTQLYIWNLSANFGPLEGDPNCITWVYHSHNMAEIEISSGLVGAILTCATGSIDEQNNRLDVDKEIVLYVHVIDENESFYARDNAKRVFPTATEAEIDAILSDSGFQTYNMMHAINGFVFASLPGFDVCVDDLVDIHFFGLGSDVDMHSLYFEGLSVVINNHRSDLASLFASIFFTAQLKVPRPLKSFLSCHIYEHFQAGLGAFLNVNDCSGTYVPSPAIPTNTRTFYIGAVEKIWDYGPTGLNAFTGETLLNDPASKPYFSTENNHIGGQYYKALFREFTDSTFIQEAPHQQHLGILGPPIYAEFGENVQIIFKNLADFDVTLTPHGVLNYNLTDNLEVSGVVHPGETSTLLWYIDPTMGPMGFDANCLSRPYSSYATPNDIYAGLLGVLVLCLPGGLKPSGRGIAGVDREFFLHLSEMNENLSPYLQKNIDTFCEDPLNVVQDGAFKTSNTLQAINGYVFGNLPGITMCNGEKIRWHVLSTGAQFDIHMPFFHGRTLTYKDGHKDTLSIFPSLTKSVDMVADNPGTWEIGCHSFDRWQEGMRAQLHITDCPGKVVPVPRRGTRATVRTYYIAAVEREWDFAPVNSIHPVTLLPLSEDPESSVFYKHDEKHIGHMYKKALFREFTDATFTVEKDRNSDGTVHLGVLGPRIHAESGDTLVVVFKNMAATRSYNFFTHGVQYPTSAEEPYTKNSVAPGETVRYTMQIPDNSGPGNSDYNCTSWLYYSAVDPIRDSMSGLFGTLVTCKPGILNAAGQRTDIDRELTILFANLDENQSWYIDENVQTYCNYSDGEPKAGDFYFSNLKFSVNGRIYANNEQLDMVVGQKVAIHMIGMGGIGDTHVMHFHGQTVTLRDIVDHRGDAFAFFPAGSTSLQMSPDNPGTWLIHCHLHSHIRFGMVTTYTVFPSDP